jgi:hypothetical protein
MSSPFQILFSSSVSWITRGTLNASCRRASQPKEPWVSDKLQHSTGDEDTMIVGGHGLCKHPRRHVDEELEEEDEQQQEEEEEEEEEVATTTNQGPSRGAGKKAGSS